MGAEAPQSCFLYFLINRGIDADSRGCRVFQALLLKDSAKIVGFKLFSNVIEDHVQFEGNFSLLKRDLPVLRLQILLFCDEIHPMHVREHIVLA